MAADGQEPKRKSAQDVKLEWIFKLAEQNKTTCSLHMLVRKGQKAQMKAQYYMRNSLQKGGNFKLKFRTG